MIENIRKYNILIILGLVVVAASLVIGLNTSNMRGPGGQPYIKIGSRTYSDVEYRQLGIDGREIVNSLAQAGDFQRMYQFLFSMAPDSMFSGNPAAGDEQFFINRMLIRQAKKEFGIHPGEEEISEFTRSLAAFRGANEEFDPEMYARYVEKGIGRMGLSERDFRDLISDIIATGHIRGIISSGLLAHPTATASRAALDQQKISGSVAHLKLAPFKEEIKPTDEQLKAYWELIQDAFVTEEQRRFTYILVTPNMPAEEASADEEKQPTLAEAAMSDEAKAEAAKKKAEEKAAKEAELAEKRRIAQRELDAMVDDFTYALEEQDGRDFEKLASSEKYGWEIRTTDLFTIGNPPDDLRLELRNSSRGGSAVDILFSIITTSDPISRISQPLAVGENQWLVARLDETIPSRTKSFEEAREQALAQYIEEEAMKALDKAVKEAAAKVETALKDGKSFADACIEAGLTEVEPFEGVDANARPTSQSQPSGLFQLARTIDPGQVAEPTIQGDHAYLIHVSSREIVENDETKGRFENEVSIATNQNSMAAFSDWLDGKAEAALIERYYRTE